MAIKCLHFHRITSASGFFIGWGIAIAIIRLVPMILSFFGVVSWISIVDVVLGVLYIVGGAMNKKALTA